LGDTDIAETEQQDAAPAKDTTLSMDQLNALAGDKPPRKPPGRPKGSKNKATTEKLKADIAKETKEIEEALAEILLAPALPHVMRVMQNEATWEDEWLINHYEKQAPRLAKEVAKQSEKFPLVRKLLLQGKEGVGIAGLASAIAAYLYGPAMVLGYLPPVPLAGRMLSVDLPIPPPSPEQEVDGTPQES
jgi:hypothetical protein